MLIPNMFQGINYSMPRGVAIIIIAPIPSNLVPEICRILALATASGLVTLGISHGLVKRIIMNIRNLYNVHRTRCDYRINFLRRRRVDLNRPLVLIARRCASCILQCHAAYIVRCNWWIGVEDVHNSRLHVTKNATLTNILGLVIQAQIRFCQLILNF